MTLDQSMESSTADLSSISSWAVVRSCGGPVLLGGPAVRVLFDPLGDGVADSATPGQPLRSALQAPGDRRFSEAR